MKKIWLGLFSLLGVFAATAQEFKIRGELKSFQPVDKVFLSYRSGDDMVRDSLQPQAGVFQFAGKLAEPTVATLQVRYVKAEAQPRAKTETMQVFLEPARINIVAKDSLQLVSVSGSAGHIDLDRMNKVQETFTARLKPLYNDYSRAAKAGLKDDQKKIETEIMRIEAEMKDKVYGSVVKEHPNSPVALYALQQLAGWDIDPDKIDPLFATLPGTVKQYPSAVAFKERIEIAKKTAVGRMAMDFTQNDTLGMPVALSSFKGKYLLVDFWASWCGPCRAENPNVVKTFNKYKDKGFTVLGVSLDRPNAKDKWLKAIHDDGLTWTHVSDLKFWDNAVAKQYAIRAIPQNFLLDPQGKIIARNLQGEELDAKLAEVLK